MRHRLNWLTSWTRLLQNINIEWRSMVVTGSGSVLELRLGLGVPQSDNRKSLVIWDNVSSLCHQTTHIWLSGEGTRSHLTRLVTDRDFSRSQSVAERFSGRVRSAWYWVTQCASGPRLIMLLARILLNLLNIFKDNSSKKRNMIPLFFHHLSRLSLGTD